MTGHVPRAGQCDAGWLLGVRDIYDTFWNRTCPNVAVKQVVIPQVSDEPWDLCLEHAEAEYPDG